MAKKVITVKPAGSEAVIEVSKDSSGYYSYLSKQWAVSEYLVNNEDFSAKYYANKAKLEVESAVSEALEEAEEQAGIATEQAQIAAQKAAELTSANKANADLSNLTEAGETVILNLADCSDDIDRIDEDLALKANTDLSNCTRPYVTESYKNGTSWYRVWSDGWCEQGGQTGGGTVMFLKTFVDTNYYIDKQLMNISSTSSTVQVWWASQLFGVTSYTTSSCNTHTPGYGITTFRWYACGYIA